MAHGLPVKNSLKSRKKAIFQILTVLFRATKHQQFRIFRFFGKKSVKSIENFEKEQKNPILEIFSFHSELQAVSHK